MDASPPDTALPAYVADHNLSPPDLIEADGAPSWVTRGGNFVVAITRVSAGTTLATPALTHEHMVLLPDTAARFETGAEMRDVARDHLVILPPAASTLTASGPGWIVRCYTAAHTALAARAANAADYTRPRDDVAPLRPWPDPPGGYRLRAYDLAEADALADKNRCYRSATLMLNVLRPRFAPRDPRALSPHAHEDFEQGSIGISGRFIHHLRTPWGPDQTLWRADAARETGSPSVTVIPPRIIHTTRNIGPQTALLADLFCPPRRDFSEQPGMVKNAADYPGLP
jgi:hypothetical protein